MDVPVWIDVECELVWRGGVGVEEEGGGRVRTCDTWKRQVSKRYP